MRLAALQAGDALVIPEGWWHSVKSQPGTIAVNFWWERPATAGSLPKAYLLRRTLQARPVAPSSRQPFFCSLLGLPPAADWGAQGGMRDTHALGTACCLQELVEERMTAELAALERRARAATDPQVTLGSASPTQVPTLRACWAGRRQTPPLQ